MAERSRKRLSRLHRVRSLQLDMVRTEERHAADRVASETALRDRIAQLSDSVAPVPAPAPTDAIDLIAAAYYRERLQRSALAAEKRVAEAEQGLDTAREKTRDAWRDQSAIEKLIARAEEAAAEKARRALEDVPDSPRKNRHDPC